MNPELISRRSFLQSVSLASTAAAATLPNILRGQPGGRPPRDKLNLACVGVGGRGARVVEGLASENFVAFCDVDSARAAATFKAHPAVPRFRDYRRMFDRMGDRIDAVTVATPDHMHYPIAVAALSLGKHVFVEKPLTHTIWEARQLAKLAAEKNVATQMGNQGHANDGPRVLKEWLQAGVLGEVRELHTWTDRPGRVWPQGGLKAPDHSQFIPVVPETLDWDVWLGIAADRPYDPAYLPAKWRGYWDFGSGALGDMGCHLLDGAYWALELDGPTDIEAISANQTDIGGPSASLVTYRYPARGALPPVKWTWYDGGLKPPPPAELEAARQLPDNGTLIVGSKATVLASLYYEDVRIIPEAKMIAMTPTLPPPTLPRVQGGHFAEWVRACKGGPPAGSNFSYSSRLTEVCLLSNLAVRALRPLVWDQAQMRVTNLPEANQYLTRAYRPGFGV